MADVKAKAVGGIGASLVLCAAGIVAFINTREDGHPEFRDTVVYADTLAGGLPTACGGLTRHITSTPVIVGEKWPAAKCEAEMRAAVAKVQGQLLRCFQVTPPQSVFDAATSHAWNVGASSTCASGAMRAWQVGEWELGCRRLYQSDSGKPAWSYVTAGGKKVFVQGLQNRRQAEYRWCIGGLK